MLQGIKKYWIIALVNIACAATFIYVAGISAKTVVCASVYEAFFIIAFIMKGHAENANTKVFDIEGDKLVVKGVFKKIEFNKSDIVQFGVSRNFLARIFDWSKVSITTNSGTHVIYTHEIKAMPELF